MHPTAKKNIELLSQICSEYGSSLVVQSYSGTKQPVDFVCKCGSPSTAYRAESIKYRNTLPLCKECSREKTAEILKEAGAKIRASSPVRDWILNYCSPYGVTPHLDTYAGPTSNMEFTCRCGSPVTRNVRGLKRGNSPLCHPCGRNKGVAISHETIRKAFEEKGLTIVGPIIRTHTPIEYLCPVEGCSSTNTVYYHGLIREGAKHFYCQKHYQELAVKRGPEHPRWNPERELRDRTVYLFSPWSKAVLASWGYRCAITGKAGRLEAHHLNSRRRFPEDALKVSNGVALSPELHWEFHQEFCGGAVHGSTLEQFKAFYLMKTGKVFQPLAIEAVIIAQDEVPGLNQLRPTDVDKEVGTLYKASLERMGLRIPVNPCPQNLTFFTPRVFS